MKTWLVVAGLGMGLLHGSSPADAQKPARTFAAKSRTLTAKAARKPAVLTPLTQREKVQQLLNRFTFGPRPGDVDQVMLMGADTWLAQQLDPDSIKDSATNRRLAAFPTLSMTVPQLMSVFPDRAQIRAVRDGKMAYPSDPLEHAMFEGQIYKMQHYNDDLKTPDGKLVPRYLLTDEQKAAIRQQDQATASRLAGELLGLPKNQRMAALIQMPLQDRIVLTGNLNNDQRQLLFADMTPAERDTMLAMQANNTSAQHVGEELEQARILRDILTERQLQEVMTDFWFNHFNVYLQKDTDEYDTTVYEREVIRKNALGSFPDLLMATAKSPAMLVYLDNYLSIGPDSLANGVDPRKPASKKGARGLNENYGRELMELHTLSVNGGYTQQDVTTLSAILTGWGVDQPDLGGGFLFDPRRHEPGPKTWLGYTIQEDGTITSAPQSAPAKHLGETAAPAAPAWGPSNTIATDASVKQGETALRILAESPKTAHFISWLLAQRFVADNPPPALVDRLASVYLRSHGDIKTILRALIASPEFNSRQYFRNKVKTPLEFVTSTFRSTATEPEKPASLLGTLRVMGMPLYFALPPTGYYLTADQWMNSPALVGRLNFAYSLTMGNYGPQKFDASRLLALGLMTPSGAGSFLGAAASTRSVTATKTTGGAQWMGVSATETGQPPVGPSAAMSGAEVALKVLESTMIAGPVSAQTNQTIQTQLAQQPAGQSSTHTLNLLTALVLGSPEFQMR